MDNNAASLKQIVCPACGRGFAPAGFTSRAVEGHVALRNMGISCPHCDWFGHCFVEDTRILRRRRTVNLRRRDFGRKPTAGRLNQVTKAQDDLKRVFEETQAKWRPVLGLVPVWDVDIESTPV